MICLLRPSVYPENGAPLRTKIRPRRLYPSMRWSFSSNSTTSQVTGERPAVPGAARSSAGVATLAIAHSVEPYML